MVATSVKNLTLESFLALPETKPASEYIDGKIVQKLCRVGTAHQLSISVDT
jgi:Uma2 family endonuclease